MTWQDKIRNPDCELCPLHEDADHVCLMGSGSRKAEVMIVGEAPGEREDESHQAFVGPAGQLLTQLLEEAGLRREDCYITNVAKCRPDNNRTPTRGEAKICVENYFVRELAAVKPRFILLLGNSALQGVARKSGITKHRGSTFAVGTATAMAAFHPAYALRSPEHLPTLRADVGRFARLVGGKSGLAGPTKVRIIKSVQQLKIARAYLMGAEVISWDLETNGLEEWHDEDSKIVSLGFSKRPGEAIVVPIYHAATPWKDPLRVLHYLKPAFEQVGPKYIAHNGKFDARWMASKGVFVRQDFDTMLAAHILDENRPKGLKPLSQILLGADAYDVGDDIKDAFNMDLRRLCIYNGKDCDYTLRLYYLFKEQFRQEPRSARVFSFLMMPASNALTRVEAVGPYVDQERWSDRFKETQVRLAKTKRKLHTKAKAPENINFNSPQQVGRWLFGDLGLPVILETKTGAPSTNETVINQLALQFPQVKLLLQYRMLTKYVSTYFANWAKRDKHSRIHPGYKLFGTVTGRLSGDFQQVPRNPFMRSILGAPQGWTFVEADYSQVELRIAAMLANERHMLRLFATGVDIHLNTAVGLTGKRPQDIEAEERKKAKPVNFGFLYGMGSTKFSSYAFDNYGVVVSDEEAKVYRDRYFEMYPGLRAWHERQRRLVRRYQRVHSPIGRVRHLPGVLSSDQGVAAESERQAINSPVQSCASDVMLMSLVRLDALLPKRDVRIVGTVHDSILFEVRTEELESTIPVIRATMEDMKPLKRYFGTDMTVPIVVEIKAGQHWGEGEVWNHQ